jgi:hypothetical protein
MLEARPFIIFTDHKPASPLLQELRQVSRRLAITDLLQR